MERKIKIKSIDNETMRQTKLAFIDSVRKRDVFGNIHILMLFIDVETNKTYAIVDGLKWMETNATTIDELKELYK